MGTFKTKQLLYCSPSLIPAMAARIQENFIAEGYEVTSDNLISGGCDISITKGGFFKAVLGMKTALKVALMPNGDKVLFEAGVGIWGQQAVPTVISMLFFWPVLLTQISGMIQQSKLDDKALQLAQSVIMERASYPTGMGVPYTPSTGNNVPGQRFCTQCGTANPNDARFCCGCGAQLK